MPFRNKYDIEEPAPQCSRIVLVGIKIPRPYSFTGVSTECTTSILCTLACGVINIRDNISVYSVSLYKKVRAEIGHSNQALESGVRIHVRSTYNA